MMLSSYLYPVHHQIVIFHVIIYLSRDQTITLELSLQELQLITLTEHC